MHTAYIEKVYTYDTSATIPMHANFEAIVTESHHFSGDFFDTKNKHLLTRCDESPLNS